jgi:hypothetical protein
MLVDLIAFGVAGLAADELEVVIGDVTANEAQTAVLAPAAASGGAGDALPIAAKLWALPFDPADRAPYAYDFSELLDDSENIDELVRITMSATGAALGVRVDTDAERLPMLDTGARKAQVWFKVDDAYQANAAFSGAGTQVGISLRVKTTASPARFYERTAILLVRQQ